MPRARVVPSPLTIRAPGFGVVLCLGHSFACVAPDPNFIETVSTSGGTTSETVTSDAGMDGEGSRSGLATSGSGDASDDTGQATTGDASATTSADTTTAGSSEDTSTVTSSASDSRSTSSAGSSETQADTDTDSTSSSETSTDSTETGSDDDGSDTGTMEVTRAIAADNNNPSAALAAASLMPLVFDHAALVAAGAQPDGSDLRIMVWDGAAFDEIDRFIDDPEHWNRTNTRVWFRTTNPIPAASTDTTSYWLRYGGDDPSPPKSSGAAVFHVHDEMDAVDYSVSGFGDWSAAHSEPGVFALEARASPGSTSLLRLAFPDYAVQMSGLIWEVRARVYNPLGGFECGNSDVLSIEDAVQNRPRGLLSVANGDHLIGHWVDGSVQMTSSASPVQADDRWHVYSLVWVTDTQTGFRDSVEVNERRSNPAWATPDHGSTLPTLSITAGSVGCAADTVHRIDLDWIRRRRWSTFPPSASLL